MSITVNEMILRDRSIQKSQVCKGILRKALRVFAESARRRVFSDIIKKSGQAFRAAAGLLGILLARYCSSHHMSALERDHSTCSQLHLLRATMLKKRCGTGSCTCLFQQPPRDEDDGHLRDMRTLLALSNCLFRNRAQ